MKFLLGVEGLGKRKRYNMPGNLISVNISIPLLTRKVSFKFGAPDHLALLPPCVNSKKLPLAPICLPARKTQTVLTAFKSPSTSNAIAQILRETRVSEPSDNPGLTSCVGFYDLNKALSPLVG